MLWPTTPVVQWPTADPKMQQIVEMLWEKLKQDPTFEALEAQECASEEVYLPEVEMDFCGYLPSNQTMDRAVDMNLPEDLGALHDSPNQCPEGRGGFVTVPPAERSEQVAAMHVTDGIA